MPNRWFVDLVYDLLMRNVPDEQRDDVVAQLDAPLPWMVKLRIAKHPELTTAAKQRRAEQIRMLMGRS